LAVGASGLGLDCSRAGPPSRGYPERRLQKLRLTFSQALIRERPVLGN